MKRIIPKIVLIAAAFYIILMLWEGALHQEVLLGGVIGSVLLAVLASIFFIKSEHAVHVGEIIVLWAMVLAFVAYGLLCFGGIL
ncbi:MAG: hypothetical protein Q4Q53_05390 [Methanocorpusculum sp.]|nr:hypothetical protein [Methanocorpusculum sp.]